MVQKHINTFTFEFFHNQFRDFRIFPDHHLRLPLYLGDLGTEPCKSLTQFGADGTAAQNQEPFGKFSNVPNGIRCIIIDFMESGDGRYKWGCTGCNHNISCGDRFSIDFHFIR